MKRPLHLSNTVRWAYAALTWALVVALLAQFFFAGMGVFAGDGFQLHRIGAWVIGLLVLLALVGSAVARRPGRTTALHGGLLLLLVVQALLLGAPGPVAALHPLNGVLILLLALSLAWGAWQAARGREPSWRRGRPGEV
jgi:hypothetical protein